MEALTRNWWILALRGALAVLFGLVALLSPTLMLGAFVLLFGTYVLLDGLGSIACALRAVERVKAAWPLLVEGVVSVALGVMAWVPRISLRQLYIIATWGLITGALEIIAASSVSHTTAGRWFLMLAGVSSVVIGGILFVLPIAGADEVRRFIGLYALIFGGAVLAASLHLRAGRAARPLAAAS